MRVPTGDILAYTAQLFDAAGVSGMAYYLDRTSTMALR
jgi:hypothetical protein